MKAKPKPFDNSRTLRAVKISVLIICAVVLLGLIAITARISIEVLQARSYATEQIIKLKSDLKWVRYPETSQKIREAALIVEGPVAESVGHDWLITTATWLLYGASEPTRIMNNAAKIAIEGRHARALWDTVSRVAVIRMLSGDPETAFEIFYNQTYLRWTIGEKHVRGFNEGAKYYLHKGVSKLSWAEAALLLAIARSPAEYNPSMFPERARERRDWILDKLSKAGNFGAVELEKYKAEPLVH